MLSKHGWREGVTPLAVSLIALHLTAAQAALRPRDSLPGTMEGSIRDEAPHQEHTVECDSEGSRGHRGGDPGLSISPPQG